MFYRRQIIPYHVHMLRVEATRWAPFAYVCFSLCVTLSKICSQRTVERTGIPSYIFRSRTFRLSSSFEIVVWFWSPSCVFVCAYVITKTCTTLWRFISLHNRCTRTQKTIELFRTVYSSGRHVFRNIVKTNYIHIQSKCVRIPTVNESVCLWVTTINHKISAEIGQCN